VTGGNRGFDDTTDSDGHGTNVAGVLLAARNDRATVGIAYDATILALRADRAGSCSDTTASADDRGCRFSDTAIATGVDRAVQAGARVINISLGGSSATNALRQAVARATSAGVIIVVSAGNDGDGSDPDIDPNQPNPFAQSLQLAGNGLVIIAGSNTDTGEISDFANRAGNFRNAYLSALGSRVCCDYENGDLRREVRSDGTFIFLISGTSFAAPQIAGAAALLAQAFPNLTGRQIVDLLLSSATDAGDAGADATFGRGILSISRAFAPQGTATLAGTNIHVPLAGASAIASGPMGDAGVQGGAGTVILDGYERAYSYDLGRTVAAAPQRPQLSLALSGRQRSLSAGNGTTSVAFSILPGHNADAAALPLALSGHDADRARVLAGSIITRLAPGMSVGFAVERGTDGLVAAMQSSDGHGPAGNAFLMADDAQSLRLLDTYGARGSAMRLPLARGWSLTMAAEQGLVGQGRDAARVADPVDLGRRTGYGRVSANVDAGWRWAGATLVSALGTTYLNESDSLLGARFSSAFGTVGARSVLVDARTQIATDDGWQFGVSARRGWTWGARTTLITGGAPIQTSAWAIDAGKAGAIVSGDRFAVRLAQPLRVEHGALRLALPTSYDYATRGTEFGVATLNLAPQGREHIAEAAWSAPLWQGQVTLNAFWRDQPGHIAAAPDDLGAAVRFALGF
jgi:hypothetical protein